MAWLRYQYWLGLLFLLPTAMVMVALWMWRQVRGGRREVETGRETRRLRSTTSMEVSVPASIIGYVIGRRGQRVKQLEESSGARIRFREQRDTEDKVAVISGRLENVQVAEEKLRELLRVKEEGEREGESIVSVPVPQHAIGRIIGRGGANIRSLQRESGAKVTVPEPRMRGYGGRGGEEEEEVVECEVRGRREEVERAVALLQESIAQSELSRRRQALAKRQHLRKPATTPPSVNTLLHSYLPSTSDFFPAFVSAVDNMGVWLQLVEGDDPASLDSVVDKMTEEYSALGPEDLVPPEIAVGSVVAAPFPLDHAWYRARVVGVAHSTAELFFVDFGDRATVATMMLKTLRSQYYKLPAQAIHCRLAGVLPKGGVWSEDAVHLLGELTLCASWKCVMVRVEGRGVEGRGEEGTLVKVVDTTTEEDVDVAEQLVEEGMAEWTEERPLGDGEDTLDSTEAKIPVVLEWSDGRSVSLAGTFSNWEPIPLERKSNGVFEGAIDLPSEGVFQFKFVVDGKWTHNPNQPMVEDGFGGYNNVLDTRKLLLAWNEVSEVCVAGTFSNWEPVPMRRKSGGSYESMFVLPTESSFEYKFVVDGQWIHKEDSPKTSDPFGGHNNILDTPPAKSVSTVTHPLVPLSP